MRLSGLKMLALCFAMIFVAPIAGATAEGELDGTYRPTPVGTKAIYNYGESWEVIAIEESKTFFKGDRSSQAQDTVWYKYKGMYYSIGDNGAAAKFDTEAIDKFFPLKIGNTTTVTGSEGDWDWKTKYKVMSSKEVDTLIGKRGVFVIAFQMVGEGNFRAKGWGYFDPEISVWHRGIFIVGDGDKYNWKTLHLELPE